MIDRPARSVFRAAGRLSIEGGTEGSYRLGHDPIAFEATGQSEEYDAVLATVPSDIFLRLLSSGLRAEAGTEYLGRVSSVDYHTALCLLLELDRQFTPFYWTNIADSALPFVGLIEQTNLVSPAAYGGRRFLYVANYVEPGDPLLDLGPEELLARYESGLRTVNPAFKREWVRRIWLFREPAAQPIVTLGYGERIPSMDTPVPGLYLANTTQIYPEDRGTNYSVRLGNTAAQLISGAA